MSRQIFLSRASAFADCMAFKTVHRFSKEQKEGRGTLSVISVKCNSVVKLEYLNLYGDKNTHT